MSDTPVVGYRVSQQQQQLYARQSASGRARAVLTLGGEVDAARLSRAVTRLVTRYEILRTTFSAVPGTNTAFQVIAEPADVVVRLVEGGLLDASTPVALLDPIIEDPGSDPGGAASFTLVHFGGAAHALLVDLPALCADDVSFGLLTTELAAIYATHAAGELAESPIQYADYAEWQHAAVDAPDDEARAGRDYWTRQDLESAASPMLPIEDPNARPGQPTVLHTVHLEPALVDRVEHLARAEHAQPAAVLFAAWHSLLGRLTDRGESLVDWLWDGRDQPELATTLGLFVRPLPIRATFDESVSFTEVLRATGDAMRTSVQHQSQLPEAVGRTTDASVVFACRLATPPATAAGVTFALAGVRTRPYRFKLGVSILWDREDARADFRSGSTLSAEGVSRLARYYVRLLEAAVADPSQPVGAADLWDEDARERVQAGLMHSRTPYPSERTYHALFEAQVAQTPDRPAVAFRGRELTYVALDEAANRLAHTLAARGVRVGHTVGLCLERSAEMIVAFLGVLKAGAAYVPLSPDHPASRLAHQLGECRSEVVITTSALADRVPASVAQVLCLDRDAAEIGRQAATRLSSTATPNDLAYVMYTSGSTGLPKGVAVRHRNIVNYAWSLRTRLGLPTDDLQHFAVVSGLTADLGLTTILPPLLSGGCVHVIGYDESIDGRLWAAYLADHPIDVLKITPSNLAALMSSAPAPAVLPRRVLICGGEFLTWDLVRRVGEAGTCRIINHYGPTETTIGVLTADITAGDLASRPSATAPLGRPIANTDVFILDARRRLVPEGVPGEIVIGGDGVSAGYINRPADTADRFVVHPFDPTARVYRTGDRGRTLPDGRIECLGRTDGQVKIRGFRVELGEIEATLASHPSVRQAIVVVKPSSQGASTLAAYIVAAGPASAEALQTYVRDRLPDYMVPTEVQAVASMPLLANGKIDRLALAARTSAVAPRTIAAPRTETERRLIGVWASVLNRQDIGIDENFFELGGHSLVAAAVVARVRTVFGVSLPLRAIFDAPTVAGLSARIDEQAAAPAPAEELSSILARVEQLSDDEVRALLKGTDR